MSQPIIFSPRAIEHIDRLAAWAGQYSVAARLKLLAAIADKVQQIEQHPESCPVAPHKPPLRRCIVTANVSLYYRIQPVAIEIVGVVDARRDPDALRQLG